MVNVDNEDNGRSVLEQRSKALFDASVTHLSGSIRSRLAQARHAAVASLQAGSQTPRQWLPALGAAMVVLTVTAILFAGPMLRRHKDQAVAVAGDLSLLLLEDDSLELIEELEFYSWLDAQHQES